MDFEVGKHYETAGGEVAYVGVNPFEVNDSIFRHIFACQNGRVFTSNNSGKVRADGEPAWRDIVGPVRE